MRKILCLLLAMLFCIPCTFASAAASEPGCVAMNRPVTQSDLLRSYDPTADNLNLDLAESTPQRDEDVNVGPSVEILYQGHDLYVPVNEETADQLMPPMTRGTSAPTSFWNLSTKGLYTATFPNGLGSGVKLYTNYYFDFYPYIHDDSVADLEGVRDGKIYTQYTIYTWDNSTATGRLMLTLYCKDCKKELITHTSVSAGAHNAADGPVRTVAMFNCGADHVDHFCYFICKNADNSSLHGNVEIAHSYKELSD